MARLAGLGLSVVEHGATHGQRRGPGKGSAAAAAAAATPAPRELVYLSASRLRAAASLRFSLDGHAAASTAELGLARLVLSVSLGSIQASITRTPPVVY